VPPSRSDTLRLSSLLDSNRGFLVLEWAHLYIYIVLKQESILIVGCQGFHHVTQHQNFFDSALCFFAALTRASRFFPFKLPSFLFLSSQLSFWFLRFIEVVVRTSDDRKSSDRRLKFSYLFICLFIHICICHYLHCTRIYQSLSLFTILFHVSTHLNTLCS